jgi:hypothetical protein
MTERRDLDALLRGWAASGADGKPLPAEGDPAWAAKADAIVAAARSARDTSSVDVLAAPPLAPESGEDASASGDKRMSSESDSGGGKPAPKPRQSLKELAQRQSVRPATSTPLPGRASSPVITPLPVAAKAAASPLPTPAAEPAVKRASEGGSDDSGVVNLKLVDERATAAQVAAAAKAKPGASSLFDDDGKPASSKGAVAAKGGAAAKTAVAKAAPAEKKGSGATTGLVIALVGIAAGVAIWQVRANGKSTPTVAESAPPKAAPEAAKPAAPAPTAVAAAPKAADTGGPAGFDPDKLPEAPSAAPSAQAQARGGPLGKEPEPKSNAVAAAAPRPVGSTGDLRSEMRKAVGADGKPLPTEPEPAALGDTRSKTLPERPSQGAVQSAIGAVLGAAKGCVAGADEATRATVTFGSSGAVNNVSVTGWASANGKSSCVVAALKGAKVGGFTDDHYSFPVTIKP